MVPLSPSSWMAFPTTMLCHPAQNAVSYENGSREGGKELLPMSPAVTLITGSDLCQCRAQRIIPSRCPSCTRSASACLQCGSSGDMRWGCSAGLEGKMFTAEEGKRTLCESEMRRFSWSFLEVTHSNRTSGMARSSWSAGNKCWCQQGSVTLLTPKASRSGTLVWEFLWS